MSHTRSCARHTTQQETQSRNTIKPKHMKNSNEFVSASRRIDPHNNTMNSLRWASIPSPTRNGKGIGGGLHTAHSALHRHPLKNSSGG
nr:MAG TPA: hypothetical protein [Caudoviricetes sp.]